MSLKLDGPGVAERSLYSPGAPRGLRIEGGAVKARQSTFPWASSGADESLDGGALTVSETAGKLKSSKSHVHNLIKGKVRGLPPLPAVHVGRRVLIPRAKFDAWFASLPTHNG